MQIKDYLDKLQTTKARTEADDIIQEFVDEINKERVNGPFKPVSFMATKMKLYAIRNNTFELRRFLSECRDYKNRNGSFSKMFFGALKNDRQNFYANQIPTTA